MDEHGTVLTALSAEELGKLIGKIFFMRDGPACRYGVITICNCDTFRDNPYVFDNFYTVNVLTNREIKLMDVEDGIHHIVDIGGALTRHRAYPISSLSQKAQEKINKKYAEHLMTKIIET